MAKCKECKKSGFFLKLNENGLCSECNKKFIQELHDYGLKVVSKAFESNIPEWSKVGYEKHLKKREEFLQGNQNIFTDNDLSTQEIEFFDVVCEQVKKIGRNPALLKLNRLSDKTLNVQYIDNQIGRIKLQGRKTKMQILTKNIVEWIENEPLEIYIQFIEKWIQYLNRLPK